MIDVEVFNGAVRGVDAWVQYSNRNVETVAGEMCHDLIGETFDRCRISSTNMCNDVIYVAFPQNAQV